MWSYQNWPRPAAWVSLQNLGYTPDQLHPNLHFPGSPVVLRHRTFEKPYFLTLVFRVGYAQESVTWGVETTTPQFMAGSLPPGILTAVASGAAWALGDSAAQQSLRTVCQQSVFPCVL